MFDFAVCLMTVQKVAFLLTVILIGYAVCHFKIVDRKAASTLSVLTTHVFSPAYCVMNLHQNFTVENLGSNLSVLALSVSLLIPVVFFARFLAKIFGRSPFEKSSLSYVFAFANTGYFGYPVIEGVFGSQVLSQFMVFCIPLNIALYSYGYGLFMENGQKRSLKKIFLSPVMISYYVGITLGLCGVSLSGFVADAAEGLGACMSPASMLSAGIVLGGFGLKKLLSGLRPYLYSAIRLLALPLVFALPLLLLGARGIYLTLPLCSMALPVGLNTVVFPESFGIDSSENAKLCFVSFLMSILTLPVVLALVSAAAEIV